MRPIASERTVVNALKKPPMTVAELLAWDATQTIRHEFVRGEVFLMAGGEDRNATVAGNLCIALRQHLRGTPCRVDGSDVKLRIEAADCCFCPDPMVTCSAADLADRLIRREPVLVVEVLSPSAAAFDRGDKFFTYRQLPSLAEVLLVDVDSRRCDLFREAADDGFLGAAPHRAGRGVAPGQRAPDRAARLALGRRGASLGRGLGPRGGLILLPLPALLPFLPVRPVVPATCRPARRPCLGGARHRPSSPMRDAPAAWPQRFWNNALR
jgi:Uma2 family endonuclease